MKTDKRRIPLILILLYLPAKILEISIRVIGVLLYLPLYIYFASIKKLIFDDRFIENNMAYIVYWIFRFYFQKFLKILFLIILELQP